MAYIEFEPSFSKIVHFKKKNTNRMEQRNQIGNKAFVQSFPEVGYILFESLQVWITSGKTCYFKAEVIKNNQS